MVRWTLADTIGLTLVTLVAGGLRVFRATTPSRLVFDEGYYAIEACEYVTTSRMMSATSSIASVSSPSFDGASTMT